MIAYICEQGAKIRREGERLIVYGQGTPQTLFSHQLEQILLFGNVHLTAQARTLLIAKKIDTVFLSVHGSYRGRLVAVEGENVFLRKRQYDLLDNEAFQLSMAREIVIAKLHNQAAMLGRLKREHHIADAALGVDELKALAHKANEATSLDSLRGMEGSGAAVYFRYFALAFHQDWGFSRRVRRPPTDPVNVVLSLVYTLLVDRCHTACRLAGLDPFPANLHSLGYGRQSLPLDLVEEFRAIFGDSLTLSMFNMRMLKKEDFEQSPDVAEDALPAPEPKSASRALILRKEAFKKVLSAFAKTGCSVYRLDDPYFIVFIANKMPHFIDLNFGNIIRHWHIRQRFTESGYDPVDSSCTHINDFVNHIKRYLASGCKQYRQFFLGVGIRFFLASPSTKLYPHFLQRYLCRPRLKPF